MINVVVIYYQYIFPFVKIMVNSLSRGYVYLNIYQLCGWWRNTQIFWAYISPRRIPFTFTVKQLADVNRSCYRKCPPEIQAIKGDLHIRSVDTFRILLVLILKVCKILMKYHTKLLLPLISSIACISKAFFQILYSRRRTFETKYKSNSIMVSHRTSRCKFEGNT